MVRFTIVSQATFRVRRAVQHGNRQTIQHRRIRSGCRTGGKADLIVGIGLINIGQEILNPDVTTRVTTQSTEHAGWENPVRVVVVVQGQTELLQIIFALAATGRFPRLLDRRQQQRDQHGYDRNHDYTSRGEE